MSCVVIPSALVAVISVEIWAGFSAIKGRHGALRNVDSAACLLQIENVLLKSFKFSENASIFLQNGGTASIIWTASSPCGTPPHRTDFFKYPAKRAQIGQNHKQILVQLVEANR